MDKNDDKRQQLIRSMFGPHRAGRGTAGHMMLWKRLAIQLSPLIGETGLAALYGRATRLEQARYSWLSPEQSTRSVDSLFEHLAAQLASVDAADAAEANIALLDTFSKLLSGLIGEALTIRLLQAAWIDESHQGNAKE